MSSKYVQEYDSQSEEYSKAFKIFLKHTDQKKKMHHWLQRIIKTLPKKNTFIEAGAGNGEIIKEFAPLFKEIIAIEPNPFLWGQLKETIPTARIITRLIKDADPSSLADLVLCSHVFYYISQQDWMESLENLASWISPTGCVAVVLQDHETDCMTMTEHFFNQSYNLDELAAAFKKKYAYLYTIQLERETAYVETNDFESAYTIAEFMLNLVPFKTAPLRKDLEDYVNTHFKTSKGTYQFSCHQDYLLIRRK